METIARQKSDEDEVAVHLVTAQDEYDRERQTELFEKIQVDGSAIGIQFTWELVDASSIHARHIVSDTGWKILLDRGLDVFQHYEMSDAFANRMQQYRACKAFEVTYVRLAEERATE